MLADTEHAHVQLYFALLHDDFPINLGRLLALIEASDGLED